MGNRRLSLDTALSRPVCTTRQTPRPAGETTASSIPSLTALPVCPKAKAVRLSSFVSSLEKLWLRRTVTNWLSGQEKNNAKMAVLLGEDPFFGGAKPTLGDFWYAAFIF